MSCTPLQAKDEWAGDENLTIHHLHLMPLPGPDELALMRRLDELYTAYPFYGSRQMSRHLVREGYAAGRDRSGD